MRGVGRGHAVESAGGDPLPPVVKCPDSEAAWDREVRRCKVLERDPLAHRPLHAGETTFTTTSPAMNTLVRSREPRSAGSSSMSHGAPTAASTARRSSTLTGASAATASLYAITVRRANGMPSAASAATNLVGLPSAAPYAPISARVGL